MPDFDPGNEKQVERLSRAAGECYFTSLRPFREFRKSFIDQFVGFYNSAGSLDRSEPIPLINMHVGTLLREFSSRNPSTFVRARKSELEFQSVVFEQMARRAVEQVRFSEAMETVVFEATVGMGVGWLSLEADRFDDEVEDSGTPVFEAINLPNWVHDCAASRWDEVEFMGRRYRVDVDRARRNPRFDPDVRRALQADSDTSSSSFERDVERTSGRSARMDSLRLYDTVHLWDVYLPKQNMMVTLGSSASKGADDQALFDGRVLRAWEWTGPKHGPFHQLIFQRVPGSTMGVPPIAPVFQLHKLENATFRKISRQAERQKVVPSFGTIDDAEKIKNAGDGDGVCLSMPSAVNEIRMGGVDPVNMSFASVVSKLYSFYAGRLDFRAGVGTSSPTLGQDQLLDQRSGEQIAADRNKVRLFTKQIMEDLVWYAATDPMRAFHAEVPIPGTSDNVPFDFTPDRMMGDFNHFDFDVEPFSMRPITPEDRFQKTQLLLQSALPLLQQSGQINDIDLMAYIEQSAHDLGIPEFVRFLKPALPTEGDPQQGRPLQSPVTTRIQKRIGVSQSPGDNPMNFGGDASADSGGESGEGSS